MRKIQLSVLLAELEARAVAADLGEWSRSREVTDAIVSDAAAPNIQGAAELREYYGGVLVVEGVIGAAAHHIVATQPRVILELVRAVRVLLEGAGRGLPENIGIDISIEVP
jgi:hypothetical protein